MSGVQELQKIECFAGSDFSQQNPVSDANTLVIGILRDALRFDSLGVKPQAVILDFRGREPSPEALLRHNGLA